MCGPLWALLQPVEIKQKGTENGIRTSVRTTEICRYLAVHFLADLMYERYSSCFKKQTEKC